MLKKTSVIIFFLLLSTVLYFVYQWIKVPDEVTPMSGGAETVAWLAFGTSIISLITAIVGLVQKLVEGKKQ